MLTKLVNSIICITNKYSTQKHTMKLVFNPNVKGLKEINESNKDLFNINMNVPALKVKKPNYLQAKRLLKSFIFDSVVNCRRYQDLKQSDDLFSTHKYILLDPDTFKPDLLNQYVVQELTSLVDRADDFSSNFETIPIELLR